MRRGFPLALALFALPLMAAACGDDDAAKDSPAAAASSVKTTAATAIVSDPKPMPTLNGPASKFSILLEDVGLNSFITDIRATIELTAKNYGESKAFPQGQGESMLKKWEYQGGYETSMQPEGRDAAILNGAFRIYVETHLFSTPENAKLAYDFFKAAIAKAGGSQPVTTSSVGNESTASKTLNGKIGASNVDFAFHQILFRRGNLVVIVLTQGADPFMKVDTVRELAQIVDEKALGKVEVVAPTPTKNYTPPVFTSPTVAPKAGTPASGATPAR